MSRILYSQSIDKEEMYTKPTTIKEINNTVKNNTSINISAFNSTASKVMDKMFNTQNTTNANNKYNIRIHWANNRIESWWSNNKKSTTEFFPFNNE